MLGSEALRPLILLALFYPRPADGQSIEPPTPAQPPPAQPAPTSPEAGTPDARSLGALPESAGKPGASPPQSPSEPVAVSSLLPVHGAQTPPPFGEKGQWVILSTSSGAAISSRTYSGSEASFFNANIGLGVDTFVARNFSLGIDLEATYGDNKGYGVASLTETTSTSLAGGLRFGLNVPLGRLWSWYPRATLGVAWDNAYTTTPGMSVFGTGTTASLPFSSSTIGPWINLYAPLLVHLAPHFFVGVGPRFAHNFGATRGGPYDGSTSYLLNADFVVGGWWGRSSDGTAENPAPATASPSRRFGQKGQLVLTSATDASLATVRYSNLSASSVRTTISPSFDYFVADHLSVGVDVSFSYSTAASFDPFGVLTNSSETVFGIGPRLGYVLLLAEWLSLWPQAEIGVGVDNFDVTSSEGTNAHSVGQAWIQASAPLLFHVATHFLLGAGPYVFHHLSSVDENHVENDATTVGASFVLGGWL